MVLSLSFKPLRISHTSYTNRFIVKGYFYIFIQSFLLILSKWAHFFITFEKEKILKKFHLLKILHYTIVRPVIKRLKDLLMKLKICLIKFRSYYDPVEIKCNFEYIINII